MYKRKDGTHKKLYMMVILIFFNDFILLELILSFGFAYKHIYIAEMCFNSACAYADFPVQGHTTIIYGAQLGGFFFVIIVIAIY